MNKKKVDILIVKLFEQKLSPIEAAQLEEWLKQGDNLDYFNEFVELKQLIQENETFGYEQSLAEIKKRINSELRKQRKINFYRYAAIFIMVIGLGYFFYSVSEDKNSSNTSTIVKKEEPRIINNEITAGESKAILTLRDGTEIVLREDTAFQKENMRSDGKALEYNATDTKYKNVEYNVLTIPRGGQFSIRLSDGTKVWLNSDSKLKYPIEFIAGQARQVELLYGEAYFDVSPSDEHYGDHFQVYIDGLQTEVLGTEFNIKAYPDEDKIQTTLVEGSITLKKEGIKVMLKPRQRATLYEGKNGFDVGTVTSFNDLLWREGVFSFKHKSLKEIMKVLERWYDMEVIFKEPSLKEVEFTGNLTKERSIEEIMNIVYLTNKVNYEIEGKTLIIK